MQPITVDLDELFGNKPCLEAAKDSGKSMNSSEQTKEGVQAAIPAVATATTPAKTFVSILEEGCKKYYSGAPPVFTSDLSEMVNMHFIHLVKFRNSFERDKCFFNFFVLFLPSWTNGPGRKE